MYESRVQSTKIEFILIAFKWISDFQRDIEMMTLRLNKFILAFKKSWPSYARKSCLKCENSIRSNGFQTIYFLQKTHCHEYNIKQMHTCVKKIINKWFTRVVFEVEK